MAQLSPTRLNAATLSTRVLSFWFRDWKAGTSPSIACQKLWFQTNNQTINQPLKQAINMEFRKDLTDYLTERSEGLNGPYTALESASPEATLSLIILTQHIAPLMDQINNQALNQSASVAQSLSMLGISNEFDRLTDPVESVFFYTPVLLSEDPELTQVAHQKSLELVRLVNQSINRPTIKSNELSGKQYVKFVRQFHELAKNHWQSVQKFGRLPHLNTQKMRTATRHELKSNKSSSNQSTSPSVTQPVNQSNKPRSSKPVKFEWPE